MNMASAGNGTQIIHLSLSEERYTLTQLRPPNTISSDTDTVSHTEHQADVFLSVIQALPS
ncbi:hypothetical protein GF319_15570 [Candidatus Bathyarchaeota archaeon]|nr:hypothetical protein [Candidatus Bathyarchaeota archaeon]